MENGDTVTDPVRKQTLNLFGGDELRLTCLGPTRVTIEEYGRDRSHGTVGDALAARDEEIERLRASLAEMEAFVEEGTRADADAIAERLVERLVAVWPPGVVRGTR